MPEMPQNAPVQEPAPTPEQPKADEAFARKERQLRKMQMELQAEKQRLESEAKRYQTEYIPKSRLMEDPTSVLLEHGYTPEQIAERLMQMPSTQDPVYKALRQQIQALEDKQKQAEESMTKAQQQQYEQAKKSIEAEAKMLIDADASFETIKAMGMHEAVVELIVQTFEESGVLLNVRDACQQVEDHLVDEGLKFANLGKVKSKLQQAVEAAQQAQAGTKEPGQQQQPALRTITNDLPVTPNKRLSEKERVARAIAAFKGELK